MNLNFFLLSSLCAAMNVVPVLTEQVLRVMFRDLAGHGPSCIEREKRYKLKAHPFQLFSIDSFSPRFFR